MGLVSAAVAAEAEKPGEKAEEESRMRIACSNLLDMEACVSHESLYGGPSAKQGCCADTFIYPLSLILFSKG